jgi:PAS domain-containing protein
VRLAPSGRKITISLSSLQEENSAVVVVRLTGEMAASEPESGPASAGAVLSLLDGLPDGFVVADGEGRVCLANRAFLEMAELASREQALGRPLSRWVGRPGADLDKVLALLREHASSGSSTRRFVVSLAHETRWNFPVWS